MLEEVLLRVAIPKSRGYPYPHGNLNSRGLIKFLHLDPTSKQFLRSFPLLVLTKLLYLGSFSSVTPHLRTYYPLIVLISLYLPCLLAIFS